MDNHFWRGGLDFFSGLLLSAIAGVAVWLISDLEIGSASEMGPGYFPLGIALILGTMGVFLVLRGLFKSAPPVGQICPRPLLFILLSFVAFGVLVDRAGLIVAILTQVAVANFASSETSLLESMLLGFILAIFSAVVFVWLLGIPVSLVP